MSDKKDCNFTTFNLHTAMKRCLNTSRGDQGGTEGEVGEKAFFFWKLSPLAVSPDRYIISLLQRHIASICGSTSIKARYAEYRRKFCYRITKLTLVSLTHKIHHFNTVSRTKMLIIHRSIDLEHILAKRI
jgi:hypothetical protein